ncbi:MAG: AbrB/MazE/SpoVT family DNA-binding domain-containing protein [Firmicutes bacterium]|nr:AbrB/MazE/SpoVT family DNA-binding domain-containing protein [Bacillota bacterium]
MKTSKVSHKGQIVIPADLRKKYGIESNSTIKITEIDGYIAIVPIPKDPITAARGMLSGNMTAAQHMAEIRKEEWEIERDKERK